MIRRFQDYVKLAGARLTLKHLGQYVSAVYLAQGVAALRSFINARWLGPADYGFWGWLVFIVSFGYHLHFGVQEIMLKDVPAWQARGRIDEARRVMQLSFSFLLLMLSIAAVLLAGVAWRQPDSTPAVLRWGWLVAGVVMLFEVLFYFEQVAARALGFFGRIGTGLLITNIVSLALTAWLVIAYQLAGIYIVAVLTPLFGFFFLHRSTKYPLSWLWSGRELGEMIRKGWSVVAMGLGYLAISWVDRLIIMKYLGVVPHGYYTLGTTLSFLIFLFPKGLADVLEPKLHFGRAQVPADRSIQQNYLLPLKVLAWLMPLGLLAGHGLLPMVLQIALPDYLPGLMVMRILIWSSYPVGLIAMAKSSLVALGRQNQAVPALLAAVGINAAASLALVKLGFGVSGVAAGSALALGLVSVWVLGLVFRDLRQSWTSFWGYAAEIYLPFMILSVPFLARAWQQETGTGGPGAGWLALTALVIYLAAGTALCVARLRIRHKEPVLASETVLERAEIAS